MTPRAWTPITAPLRERVAAMPADGNRLARLRAQNRRQQEAEDALRALAPEMAEMLLRMDDDLDISSGTPAADLVDRIRAIAAVQP